MKGNSNEKKVAHKIRNRTRGWAWRTKSALLFGNGKLFDYTEYGDISELFRCAYQEEKSSDTLKAIAEES